MLQRLRKSPLIITKKVPAQFYHTQLAEVVRCPFCDQVTTGRYGETQ